MKYLLAILFLSVSVFLLIFAKRNQSKLEASGERNSIFPAENFTLDHRYRNVFWFLQISDLHLSKFKDPTRISDFRIFCKEVIEVVKPKVVIASGDLTDAKDQILGSEQYTEEWQSYYKTLVETGVLNKTNWLDIRGNHDNFNVQYLYHASDFFRNFSAQGRNSKRSYLHQEQLEGVKYNFVALDASMEPGAKRPYNFIGIVDNQELKKVEDMVHKSNGDLTVWFAHYPTSTILTSRGSPNIRKFIGKFDSSLVFVAGHLHTLGRLVNNMYTLQPEGFLELELADFLRTRRFRIGVLDHGLLSISDIPLGTYPIAIITNPKNMLLNNPFKENIELQKMSTHIRILAFSKSPIITCKVRIDKDEWKHCTRANEKFFSVPWQPSQYLNGKHLIELFVEDESGMTYSNEHYFALDGTKMSFDVLAKFILMNDLTTIFQIAYIIALTLCVLPLIIFKVWHLLLAHKKVSPPMIKSYFWKKFVQKYLLLASVDKIFYGLIVMIVWTTFGPWSFHEILDGHTGYIFLWGTFVKGQYIPGTLSYWYGIHQFVWFQIPLNIILAGVIKRSYIRCIAGEKTEKSVLKAVKSNLPFVALVVAETLLAIFYIITNDLISFLICPLRCWSLIYSIILFYQCHWRISEECFKNFSKTFLSENEPKQS